MGLLLSVLLSYSGSLEAIQCVRQILRGMVPEGDPDFEKTVQYYSQLIQRASSTSGDWTTEGGQGYLCLNETEEGKLTSASVKYYDGRNPDSTAILFSTKISSFGQDSVESNSSNHNGDYKRTPERYTSTTKTIIPQATQSFSTGQRYKSPTESCENISDPTHSLGNSFDSRGDDEETSDAKEKLTWHYRPLSPVPQAALPEIHFQSFEQTAPVISHDPDTPYSEDFLRSLDGVKFRPLQRGDPSGRRRSYKKRNSSSSTSSRESKASREEELKMFTSLEEAEFANYNNDSPGYGSTPNLTTRSHSRSRSQENTKESKPNVGESSSFETSADSVQQDPEYTPEQKSRLKDLPKLDSFEEEKADETAEKQQEVNENDDEYDDDIDDFWGKSDD